MYRLSIQLLALIVIITVVSVAVRAFHPDASTLDAGLSRDEVGEGEIWVNDAFELSRQPGGVLWIDLRPPEVFASDHVPGALNFWPHGDGGSIGNVLYEHSENLGPDTTIVVYCASIGCNDSHQMKSELEESTPFKVFALAGGWQEYRRYVRRTDS